jgi:MerR family transcriptional regulator/heat shock protein HspR
MYVISIAAELAGVHPQTLRVYERRGLLAPRRTQGNSRRYSERDIEVLRRIQELTNEGLNLAGVLKVMELEQDLANLKRAYVRIRDQLAESQEQLQEAMSASETAALVPFKDIRRVRRALKSDLIEQAATRRHFIAPPIPDDDR